MDRDQRGNRSSKTRGRVLVDRAIQREGQTRADGELGARRDTLHLE